MPTPLPIIPRPIDNTALDAFMACPWRYYASMVLHRRKEGTTPALTYGTAWHAALECRYRGGSKEDVMMAAVEAWEPHGKPDDHRTLERLLLEYDNYCDRWGARPEDEHGQTVGYPENPIVEISTNAIWEGARHPYAGKLDRLVEIGGQYFVEDHKTTSRMGSYYFKEFAIDNQMLGYAWLMGLITGVKIAGVRINAHAIYKRESKFERQILNFTKDQLEDWAENYNFWVERIEGCYVSGIWPRNYKACVTRFGLCQYHEVCSMPPHIRMKVLEMDFVELPWNPLEKKGEESVNPEE